MKTRAAIAVATAAGLSLIIRTAMHYAGADTLALGITALMGVVLLMGMLELWMVAGQNAALGRELSTLPAHASEDDLARLSPLLRALILARMDRSPMPAPSPVFAPYLVGLLVMLGLLGTFMGLFETLRGAGTALTASTELADLRGGLQQSMQGLMRSFGTSAVGVATSAVLGLSAVFCRRSSHALATQIHTLAAGALSRHTTAQRQLVALEQLSAQGDAWPAAIAALSDVSRKLEALQPASDGDGQSTGMSTAELSAAGRKLIAELERTLTRVGAVSDRNEQALGALGQRWEEAHARALDEQTAAMKAALSEIGTVIERGVWLAGERTREALTPILTQAVGQTTEAASEHLDKVLATVQQAAQAHREEQLTATDAVQQRLAAFRDQQDAVLSGLQAHAEAQRSLETERSEAAAEQHGRTLAALTEFAQRAEQLEARRAEEATTLTKQLSDELSSTTTLLRERMTALSHNDEAQLGRTNELFAELQKAATTLSEHGRAQLEQIETFVQTSAAHKQAEERQGEERILALFERVDGALQRQAEQLSQYESALSDSRKEREQWALERNAEVASQLSDFGEKLEAQHANAAAAMIEQVGRAGMELTERVGKLGQDLLQAEALIVERHQALAEKADEQLAAQLDKLNALQEGLAERHKEGTQSLAELFTEQVGALAAKLEQSGSLVAEAAELVRSGGAELVTVAETFGAAAEQQRRAANQWLESLGDIERLVTDAGETAAADVLGQHLARTHEVFDRQLRFQQELIAQLNAEPRRRAAQEQGVDATA